MKIPPTSWTLTNCLKDLQIWIFRKPKNSWFLISHFNPNLTSFRKDSSKHIPACLPTPTPKLILWQSQGLKAEPLRKGQCLVWSLETLQLWLFADSNKSSESSIISCRVTNTYLQPDLYYWWLIAQCYFKRGGLSYTQLPSDSSSTHITTAWGAR